MASYKNFQVSYTFASGDTASVKVKAPKHPSRAAIAKAVVKAGIVLPDAPTGMAQITRCIIELGMGSTTAPMKVFAASGTDETFLYSYAIDEIM